MKIKIIVLFFLFSSCSNRNPSLFEVFKLQKNEFNIVVREINKEYLVLNSKFKVKLTDGSFILSNRILMDTLNFPKTIISDFINRNKDIEIKVLDSNEVWFQRKTDENLFKSEIDIIFYAPKRNKKYADSLMREYYSNISRVLNVDTDWYFISTTKYVD